MSDESPLDEQLLAKVMRSVRLEVRIPMRLRIAKVVKGKLQDSHELEVEMNKDLAELQREITSLARHWKGGFEVGTVYTVERLA